MREDRLVDLRLDGALEVVSLPQPDARDPHPSRGPLEAWAHEVIAAIQAGRPTPPSFEDGLCCQAVMDAAHSSHAVGGGWVDVEPS